MKCSVSLKRIDVTGYPLPSFSKLPLSLPPVDLSLVKAEPVSPSDIDTSMDFNTAVKVKTEAVSPTNLVIHQPYDYFLSNQTVVNTIRETKARPFSKIRSHSAAVKTETPLMKIRAAQPAQPKQDAPLKDNKFTSMDIVNLLRRCQLCKVLLVDCMKNLPMPLYNTPMTEDEGGDEYRKPKKEKKKKHKV